MKTDQQNNSLSWILDSKAQDFIFHKQNFSGFQIPDFYIERARC